MKTKEEILKHHLKHISFEQSEKTFDNVCQAMEEYASQQLSALQQESETLKATFEEFKRAMAEGSELYANLTIEGQEFTAYQLALQENERLKAELKELQFAGITPGLLDKPIRFPGNGNYRIYCGWVVVKTESDLPKKHIEDNTGDITYVTRIMHDDGRGGNHIVELTRDEIWEASQSEDGRVDWLDENISPSGLAIDKTTLK